jgi:hypothetical protein
MGRCRRTLSFGEGGQPVEWSGSFDELLAYLRGFRSADGKPGHDTYGVLRLLGTLADNLREHADDEILKDIAAGLTDEQATVLYKLAEFWVEGYSGG